MWWRVLLVAATLASLALAQDTRNKIRRPRLRVRPDRNSLAAQEEVASEKDARQLSGRSRSRTRIRRPALSRPSPVNDVFVVESQVFCCELSAIHY